MTLADPGRPSHDLAPLDRAHDGAGIAVERHVAPKERLQHAAQGERAATVERPLLEGELDLQAAAEGDRARHRHPVDHRPARHRAQAVDLPRHRRLRERGVEAATSGAAPRRLPRRVRRPATGS